MLYDEQLARAQRASIEPDVTRTVTQAEARRLRKALRWAGRRRESLESAPPVVEPVAVPATPVTTEPAPAEA